MYNKVNNTIKTYWIHIKDCYIKLILLNIGIAFDTLLYYLFIYLLHKCRISTEPSPSRWGITSFAFSIGMFFIALAAQLSNDINNMTPMYIVGYVFVGIALLLSIYFLRHQKPSDTDMKIQNIERQINTLNNNTNEFCVEMKILIEKINELNSDIKRDRENKNKERR